MKLSSLIVGHEREVVRFFINKQVLNFFAFFSYYDKFTLIKLKKI